MRLALVALCLLAVVAVTVSPSSGNPAPGIKDWFKGVKEKIKNRLDKIGLFKKDIGNLKGVKDVKELIKASRDKINSKFRGRRDVDFESSEIYDSDLRALSDLLSAQEDASDDILSSVEDVYNSLERGSFEGDVNQIEDSDEDAQSAEDSNEDDKSAEDGDEFAEDVDKSAEGVDKSAEDVDKSAEISDDDDKSAEDVDEFAEDVDKSAEGVDKATDDVDKFAGDIDNDDMSAEDVDNSDEESGNNGNDESEEKRE